METTTAAVFLRPPSRVILSEAKDLRDPSSAFGGLRMTGEAAPQDDGFEQ